MDPLLAKQLLASGAISQQTYDAALSNKASVDPSLANQSHATTPLPNSDQPFGPPTPATGEAGLHAALQAKLSGGHAPAGNFQVRMPENYGQPKPEQLPANVKAEGSMQVAPAAQRQAAWRANEAPAPKASAPSKPEGPRLDKYDTKLSADDEASFQQWKKEYAPNDSGADYDLRGAFKAGVTPDPENGHMPDTWKKPNHPTFSVESQYARGTDRAKAGHWRGEEFVPAPKSSDEMREQHLGDRLYRTQNEAAQEKDIAAEKAAAEISGAEKAIGLINTQLQSEEEQVKRRDAMQQEAYEKRNATLDAIREQHRMLGNQEIDPDRKWKNMPTGSKLMFGAAAMLGGIGQGMMINAGARGATNPVMDQWEKGVQQDIMAQQFAITNKRSALDEESNIVAKQYALDQDMIGYQKAKMVEGWQKVQHQLDALSMGTDNEKAKADLKKAALVIDQKVNAAADQLQDYEFQRLQRREQAAAAAAAAQAARVEKMRGDVRTDTKKLMDEHGLSLSEAFRVAYARNTGMDPSKSDGAMPAVPTKQELDAKYRKPEGAKEDQENEARRQALQSGFDKAQTYAKYFASDPKGDVTSKVPTWGNIPGSDAMQHRLKIEDWNTSATLALGPIVEAMNKGKPGAVELRVLQSEVQISPYMTNEEKVRRVKRLQELQAQAAAISGHKVGAEQSKTESAGPSVKDVAFK